MEVAGVPIFPTQASIQAGPVDLLLFFLLGLASFFSLIVAGLIVFFSIKYRRRSEDEIPQQIEGSTRLEIFWTAVPLGLAMVAFFWSARLYLDLQTPPKDALEIYALGKQWMWKFEHFDGQLEINELHIPVDQPIKLVMTSQDVIHSFYVPDFRVKQDVLPNRYTTTWFQATKTGTYHLFCAEYCGTNHARMIGSVIVMDPAAYQTWLSGGPTQSLASEGQKLFAQLGCNSCHRNDSLRRAPVLEGLYGQPVQLQNGQIVTADDNYIRESILNPGAKIVAGYQPIMPSFQGRLGEEQILQLIAYIRSIGPQNPQGTQGTQGTQGGQGPVGNPGGPGGGENQGSQPPPATTPRATPAVALTEAGVATPGGGNTPVGTVAPVTSQVPSGVTTAPAAQATSQPSGSPTP